MEQLSAFDLELLRGGNFAHVATLAPDGSPHVTVTWIDSDGTHALVNTAKGRVKDRHLRRDPRVAVSVHALDDGYRVVGIHGRVVEIVEGDEADVHIDALSRRYHDGRPWTPQAGQVRVLFRIAPEHILRYGAD